MAPAQEMPLEAAPSSAAAHPTQAVAPSLHALAVASARPTALGLPRPAERGLAASNLAEQDLAARNLAEQDLAASNLAEQDLAADNPVAAGQVAAGLVGHVRWDGS